MEDSTPSNSLPPGVSPRPGGEAAPLAVLRAVIVLALFLTLGSGHPVAQRGLRHLVHGDLHLHRRAVGDAARRYYEPLGYTGLRAPPLAPAALGFGLGVANFFAFVVPIQYAAQTRGAAVAAGDVRREPHLRGTERAGAGRHARGVSLAAPFCEEFFFRGVFQKGVLRTSLSQAAPCWSRR